MHPAESSQAANRSDVALVNTEGNNSKQNIDVGAGAPPPGFDSRQQVSQDVRLAPPPGFGNDKSEVGTSRNVQSSSIGRQRHNRRYNHKLLPQDRGPSRNDYEPRNTRQQVDNRSYNNRGGYRDQRGMKSRMDHAGVKMMGHRTLCLICCQESDLYAIAPCLHPMCMECAIRTRILGKCTTCPQCRMEIETLYFVQSPKFTTDFSVPVSTIDYSDDQRYGVKFQNKYAVECFESYMSHKCYICSSRGEEMAFDTFPALQQHMNQAHQLTFCHLCVENMNVLTKDRKAYTRQNLQKHMKAEFGEKGFKGHPKCLFCDLRFYDDEAQYKHLRKDHYFCQICDADGADNVFYKNHYDLVRHYKKAHFPCDNRDCESMGIVFRSELELNVHKAKTHSGSGSGARTLPLDFQYSRNGLSAQASNQAPVEQLQPPVETARRQENFRIVPSAQNRAQPVSIVRSALFNARSSSDFPSLESENSYGAPPNWRAEIQTERRQTASQQQQHIQIRSGEQFPSLSGTNSGLSQFNETSVWSKKNTKDLFKPEANGRNFVVPQPKEKRKPVLPLPDIWPEDMQEKLRARALGLPIPDEQENNHTTPLVDAEPKKNKKKKSKTVPMNSIPNPQESDFVPTSSKFELLSAYDEGANKSRDWWSRTVGVSAKKPQGDTLRKTILTPTSDDFVRIETAKPTQISDEGSHSSTSFVNQSGMSLKTIAMAITETEDSEVTKKKPKGVKSQWDENEESQLENEQQKDNQQTLLHEDHTKNSPSNAEKIASDLFTL